MHYTEKMKNEIREKDETIEKYETFLNELQAYLRLPKFENDHYVNRDDIFHRINEFKTFTL